MSHRRQRIVIVDDNRGLRVVTDLILRESYEVATASTGQEAVALLERGDLDLVVTDLEMPGMSGIELIERALAAPRPAHVLVVSAWLDEARRAWLTERAIPYLEKPYEVEELLAKINALLRQAAH